MKTNTTDTPRTDACPHCGAEISIAHKGGKPRFYKCQSRIGGSQTRPAYCCEREKSQKLENALASIEEYGTKEINEALKLRQELAKAEAEVERLRANLRRAIEIAEIYSVHLIYPTLEQEISTLKATLNQTTDK